MEKIKSHFNSLFYGWLFTSQGLVISSAVGAIALTWLTKITNSLAVYAPVSYLIAAFMGAIFSAVLVLLFKKILSPIYRGETYITISFDGVTIRQENRKNVWGWKDIHLVKHELTTGVKTLERITIVACFDRPLSPDTLTIIPLDHVGCQPPRFTQINYEARYAIIDILSLDNGRYKIEFKGHET